MKQIFDDLSQRCSKITTTTYSTSFSLGIYLLDRSLHCHIYNIYGFVRLADEIVDSFHGHDKRKLLKDFRNDTVASIENKISLNPILNAFQYTVNKYAIDWELIDTFLKSMEMDLDKSEYNQETFEQYILGSAEVVGLMCLRVFTDNNNEQYLDLKGSAMKLGSAFQKINFLRDIKADFEGLGRSYFPGIDLTNFDTEQKQIIEENVKKDFDAALIGIKKLPKTSRMGVYLAYVYYLALYNKIRGVSSEKIMSSRIRIPNSLKFTLMVNSFFKVKFNLI